MFVSTKSKTTVKLTSQDLVTLTMAKRFLDAINEAFDENSHLGFMSYEDLFDIILNGGDSDYEDTELEIVK